MKTLEVAIVPIQNTTSTLRMYTLLRKEVSDFKFLGGQLGEDEDHHSAGVRWAREQGGLDLSARTSRIVYQSTELSTTTTGIFWISAVIAEEEAREAMNSKDLLWLRMIDVYTKLMQNRDTDSRALANYWDSDVIGSLMAE